MKLTLVLGLLTAGIVMFSCGAPSQKRTSQTRAKLPFGSVDIPRSGDTARGNLVLGGWALSEAGIKEVCVYVDRTYVRCGVSNVSRPDVSKAFPAIPHSDTSGWNLVFETAAYLPGMHEITVQAVDNNGATRDLATIPVNFATP